MSRGRSAPRTLVLVLVVLVNVAFGLGVYHYLDAHKSALTIQASKPGDLKSKNAAISRLPGTLYMVQGGALYRLQRGTFTTVLAAGGWTQPALAANGQSVLVVKRDAAFSDLYQVDSAGHIEAQLTRNASKVVEANHWAFYPRLAPDGSAVYFSYDVKDRGNNFDVVMSVLAMPPSGSVSQARRWTMPNSYTGGDVQPVPLPGGGIIYTKYNYFDQKVLSQIWLAARPGTLGRALTAPEEDCSQPALAPDGRRLAMICTAGKQVASIELATFDGSALGPRLPLVTGRQASQPTWAPDGGSLVFVAPAGLSGHFQLWLQQAPLELPPPTSTPSARPTTRATARATPTPPPPPPPSAATATPTPVPAPVQLTPDLDFDATSTIAWG
jgi:hypothetical protein